MLFSMVALHGQSPEQPQFHLQKYMSTNSSYKSISNMQGPQKCIYFSLRLFNSSGTGPFFHLDLLVLLTSNVAVLREDEESEILSPNLAAVPSP